MPIITGPILDSSGYPANGQIRVQVSAPFDAVGGHLTTAIAYVTVRAGIPTVAGSPWSIQPCPPDYFYTIWQDLDGVDTVRFNVTVPDALALTYSELRYHRGHGAGGPQPFVWDLTGGLDFPPEAVNGDYGIDTITGDFWRYDV